MSGAVLSIESRRAAGRAPTDEELMALVRRGSRTAMTTLAGRHMPRLTSYCAKCVGDAAIAEDVVQETFLRVWQHRADYEERGKFVVWLFTLARNLCRNHLRGSGRRNRWIDPGASDTDVERVAAAADQASSLAARQEAERALRALDALSAEMRDALLLRFDGELAYDEIAAIVGVSESTLRSRVHHGLKALRAVLERGES